MFCCVRGDLFIVFHKIVLGGGGGVVVAFMAGRMFSCLRFLPVTVFLLFWFVGCVRGGRTLFAGTVNFSGWRWWERRWTGQKFSFPFVCLPPSHVCFVVLRVCLCRVLGEVTVECAVCSPLSAVRTLPLYCAVGTGEGFFTGVSPIIGGSSGAGWGTYFIVFCRGVVQVAFNPSGFSQ